jgi:hypothetical protein
MSSPDIAATTLGCPKCGADVRADSQFCYNCGGPLSGGKAVSENGSNPAVSEPVESPTMPAPGLRSAKEIRRQKTFSRKRREIVWEPISGSGREAQLLIITAAVAAFTIVVIFLAFYLH